MLFAAPTEIFAFRCCSNWEKRYRITEWLKYKLNCSLFKLSLAHKSIPCILARKAYYYCCHGLRHWNVFTSGIKEGKKEMLDGPASNIHCERKHFRAVYIFAFLEYSLNSPMSNGQFSIRLPTLKRKHLAWWLFQKHHTELLGLTISLFTREKYDPTYAFY